MGPAPLTVTSGFWIGNSFLSTVANAAGVADTLDSDGVAQLLNMRNASVIDLSTAAWGSRNRTLDFGFQDPPLVGSDIGNFLWIDSNADGLQTVGEEPLAGVLVQLLDGVTGSVLATTLSSASGQYKFNTLDNGFRSDAPVVVALPLGQTALAGVSATAALVGAGVANLAIDSNGAVNATSMRIEARLNAPGDGFSDQTIDFGFLRLEIGDYVWLDLDNAGDQGTSEAARANVTVRLETTAGVLLATTATSEAGLYLFTSNEHGLRADSNYVLVIDTAQPRIEGFNVTVANANALGTNDTTDSDAVALGGSRVGISVRTGALGTRDFTYDFGFFRLLEIGNFVWNDLDGDGVQDATETPLVGVLVELRSADGSVVVATTLTNSSGAYLFDAVRSGVLPDTEYVVAIPMNAPALAGLTPTFSPSQASAAEDSNGVLDSVRGRSATSVTTGAYGTVDRSIDFGFVGVTSIGDFVWLDADGDGTFDSTEAPVANVTLQLRDASDAIVATTTTSATGLYAFDNTRVALRPNTPYTIVVPSVPAGLQLTRANVGANDAIDSDATLAAGVVRKPAPTGAVAAAC